MAHVNKRSTLAVAALGIVLLALSGCDTKPVTPGGGDATTPSASGSGGGATASRPPSTGEGTSVTGDTIPIGVVASMTGDNLPWGVDCVAGAQLAVDEVNAKGGIKGKKVKLVVADDASKPEQGKSAVEKLIDGDKVLAVIGEVSSGITKQMAPVCQEKGVPDIAVGATKTDLNTIGNDFFRVCYTDALQGPAMAVFAYDKLGLRKVAVMTDKTQIYSTGLSDSFKKKFQDMGGTIVDEEFYESKQTNFTGQLTNLKAKSPEGVFASGYFNEVGPIVKQAAEAGLKVPFFGGDGWDSSQIINTGGAAIIGDYYCNHYVNDDKRPVVQEFLTKWKAAKGGKVPGTAMGALGYDATAIALDALGKASALDSKSLRDALDNETDFKGVSGNITLKGMDGNPLKTPIVVKLTPTGTTFAYNVDTKSLSK